MANPHIQAIDAIKPPARNQAKTATRGIDNEIKEIKKAIKKEQEAPDQAFREEERVTFWLPASESQRSLNKPTHRKPGESMFTLPVRGSSKGFRKEDPMDHTESIYRLPPPKPWMQEHAKVKEESKKGGYTGRE